MDEVWITLWQCQFLTLLKSRDISFLSLLFYKKMRFWILDSSLPSLPDAVLQNGTDSRRRAHFLSPWSTFSYFACCVFATDSFFFCSSILPYRMLIKMIHRWESMLKISTQFVEELKTSFLVIFIFKVILDLHRSKHRNHISFHRNGFLHTTRYWLRLSVNNLIFMGYIKHPDKHIKSWVECPLSSGMVYKILILCVVADFIAGTIITISCSISSNFIFLKCE